MKKTHIAINLSSTQAREFAQLYDEISSDWELKAEKLQARRWQNFKRGW